MDVSGNQISTISPLIGQLADLKLLKANKCKLESVPNEIAQLSHLHLIELKNNQLKSFLPKMLKHEILLHSLVTLDLSNNRLTAVPSALKHLPSLSNLFLAFNQITDLSKLCRPGFESLFVLDLSNNKLASIPNAFAYYVKNAQNLNFANNDLAKFPHNIGLLPQIKTIQAQHSFNHFR